MTETRWWFVRHAPVPNPEKRCYGQKDVECDTTNAAAFENLAKRVPREAVWVATPLSRTQRTMRAIHQARGTTPDPLHLEPRLAEQSFGDWQGRTYAENSIASTDWPLVLSFEELGPAIDWLRQMP